MNILMTGASGLIGRALSCRFEQRGHTVYRVSRNADSAGLFYCNHRTGAIRVDESVAIDVVINLAGETSRGRWSEQKKQEMVASRVLTTRLLAHRIAEMNPRPSLFISASAVGYYGNTGDREVNEDSAPGGGFLAELAQQWEAAAEAAGKAGIRTINARFGVVLSPAGGALKEMLLPFRLGLGGRIGSGRQYWSWVGLTELLQMVDFVIEHEAIHGPVNFVACSAVSNAELTGVLAKLLSRPALLHIPAFAARMIFTEMADEMLLSSCRAVPARLLEHGYQFVHGDLASALHAQLSTR